VRETSVFLAKRVQRRPKREMPSRVVSAHDRGAANISAPSSSGAYANWRDMQHSMWDMTISYIQYLVIQLGCLRRPISAKDTKIGQKTSDLETDVQSETKRRI